MPSRILRDGILSSESVNSLNWAEEVFYRRLHSVVDDFGRYYASPKLLRAACYPLHIDKVSDSDIGKWLTACVTAALVRVYPAPDGKRYLEVLNFRQQVRAKVSKFPQMTVDPPPLQSTCVADAKQMKSNVHLGGVVFGVEDEGGGGACARAKVVDNSTARPPPISFEFMEVLKSRPELDPDTVWQNFVDYYPSEKRTIARWKKWVSSENSPMVGETTAAVSDPDSRASIETLGLSVGIGKWDEAHEQWPVYKNRVLSVERRAPA